MPWAVAAAVGGALISKDASRKAANTQADAAREANALTADQYGQTVERNRPFVEGGTSAFNQLLARLNSGQFGAVPTAEQVMAEPGYQFGLDQGQNALGRVLNARGMSYSGSALKEAQKFGQNYATGQYGNAFNRLQGANDQAYRQWGNIANMGQNAANNTGQAGASYANSAGNNLIGAGDASAANALAQGNIWGGALNQGVSAYRNRPATGAWGSTGGGSSGWGSGDAWGNQDLGQYLG